MKKLAITTGIIGAALLGLFYIGKLTGALRLYSCPSGANEPTFKTGSHFFASTFKKPARFDFIIFERDSREMPGTKELIFYRLCGMPGDKVELKNGVLWVNGRNADERLNIMNEYLVTRPDEMARVRALASGADELDPATPLRADWGDSLLANLSTAYVKQNRLRCRLYTNNNPSPADSIVQKWDAEWTWDNFGPITVPKDNFFVLGDNRHNALDSRFTGYVTLSAIKGTVLH